MGCAVVVASGKGGTGKTCVTGAVAAALARLGRKVLCVDMDAGLRNLDLSLGMSDRALMDFSDVAQGRCPLSRAAAGHPDVPGLFLLTAPMSLPPSLGERDIRELVEEAGEQYDYVLLDAPPGLGDGFRLAACATHRALVVATGDPPALRGAQRAAAELGDLQAVHLVMNRVQPRLLRQTRTTIDQAMDAVGLPLIGVVPEDPQVALALSRGLPLALSPSRGAAAACANIARRLEGESVPLMFIR